MTNTTSSTISRSLSGCYTALITPFRDGLIDEPALRALVERQIAGGVSGLVPCGTTGEAPALTAAGMGSRRRDRRRDGRRARAGPRRHGLQQHGRPSSSGRGERARWARTARWSSRRTTTARRKTDCTGTSRRSRRRSTCRSCSTTCPAAPGSICCRRRSCDWRTFQASSASRRRVGRSTRRARSCARRRQDFVVLSGDDSLTLPMMGVGGSGVISVVSNIAPEAVSALTSACLAGDFVTRPRHPPGALRSLPGDVRRDEPVAGEGRGGAAGILLAGGAVAAGATERGGAAARRNRARGVAVRRRPPRSRPDESSRQRGAGRHCLPRAVPEEHTMTLRIGIAGIRGRMGREIAALAANDQRMTLVGGLSRRHAARTRTGRRPAVRGRGGPAAGDRRADRFFCAQRDGRSRGSVRVRWRAAGLRHDRARRRPDGGPARGGGASRGLPRGEHESRGERRPRRLARARARPRGLRRRDRRGAPPAQSGRAVRDRPGAGASGG